MAKFYGKIGFQIQKEVRPGIWKAVIEEHTYAGDVLRQYTRFSSVNEKVNDDINISNDIAILADPFAMLNFSHMIYVCYMGQRIKISDVEPLYPRIKFSMGGVYNGPTAENAESPCGCDSASG